MMIYTSYGYVVWVDEKWLTGEVGHTFHDYELQLLWVTFQFLEDFIIQNQNKRSVIHTKSCTINWCESHHRNCGDEQSGYA